MNELYRRTCRLSLSNASCFREVFAAKRQSIPGRLRGCIRKHKACMTDNIPVPPPSATSHPALENALTGNESLPARLRHDALPRADDAVEHDTGTDTRPIQIVFTVRYTELGMERLYDELSAKAQDLDRARHVKRCLIDIVRGDFKRAPISLPPLGISDRGSFKVRIRISVRDLVLDGLFADLKQLKTSFHINNHIRRKLYNAFTSISVQPSSLQPVVAAQVIPAARAEESQPAALVTPSPSSLGSAADRRNAIRKENKSLFSGSF